MIYFLFLVVVLVRKRNEIIRHENTTEKADTMGTTALWNAIAQKNGTTKAENHNSHRLGHDIWNNTFDIEKTLVNLSSDLFLMHKRFCCQSLCREGGFEGWIHFNDYSDMLTVLITMRKFCDVLDEKFVCCRLGLEKSGPVQLGRDLWKLWKTLYFLERLGETADRKIMAFEWPHISNHPSKMLMNHGWLLKSV